MALLPDPSIPRVVKVRSLEGSEKLNVIFDDILGHHHSLSRDKDEHVSKTLTRIVLSSQKVERRNRKRKRIEAAAEDSANSTPIEAHLYAPTGAPVEGEVPNCLAWEEGSVLKVGPTHYNVHVNVPTVLELSLPDLITTDCPTVPQVEVEFTDFYLCQWEWFHCPDSTQLSPDPADLQRVSTACVYWPSDADIGCKLLLKCTPVSSDGRTGECVTKLSTVTVGESPKVTPITRRHLLTPSRLARPEAFRVVTYNTLAGVFTSEDYARQVLYPYCDPAALDIKYRQGRIMHELIGYNADVLSLQEVGTTTFSKFLLPALRDKGYDGCYQPKSGQINEGEAIFYDTSRFTLVAQESVSISDFFTSDPSCSEMLRELQGAPIFLNQVTKKSSIVLAALLRSMECPSHHLLVANTHLYYHPKGDHVRLVQMAVMVKYLRTLVDKYSRLLEEEEGRQGARIATVIGGDFNSCPCIAAYDFLVKGHIGKYHEDWMGYRRTLIPRCPCYYKHNEGLVECSNTTDRTDRTRRAELAVEETLPPHIQFELNRQLAKFGSDAGATPPVTPDTFRGMELRHNFRFENVTGTKTCTNYTSGFKAVLDYIVIDSDSLEAERVVPLPSLEEVSEFVALPSVYFPSDHLALVADLKWKL